MYVRGEKNNTLSDNWGGGKQGEKAISGGKLTNWTDAKSSSSNNRDSSSVWVGVIYEGIVKAIIMEMRKEVQTPHDTRWCRRERRTWIDGGVRRQLSLVYEYVKSVVRSFWFYLEPMEKDWKRKKNTVKEKENVRKMVGKNYYLLYSIFLLFSLFFFQPNNGKEIFLIFLFFSFLFIGSKHSQNRSRWWWYKWRTCSWSADIGGKFQNIPTLILYSNFRKLQFYS